MTDKPLIHAKLGETVRFGDLFHPGLPVPASMLVVHDLGIGCALAGFGALAAAVGATVVAAIAGIIWWVNR